MADTYFENPNLACARFLVKLWDQPNSQVAGIEEAAQAAGMGTQSARNYVAELQRQGLIGSEKDPENRRRIGRIFVTEAGAKEAERLGAMKSASPLGAAKKSVAGKAPAAIGSPKAILTPGSSSAPVRRVKDDPPATIQRVKELEALVREKNEELVALREELDRTRLVRDEEIIERIPVILQDAAENSPAALFGMLPQRVLQTLAIILMGQVRRVLSESEHNSNGRLRKSIPA